MRPLRWYQQACLNKYQDSNSAFFAMKMRLGKTLTAIRWADAKPNNGARLIVCPKTVISAWEIELNNEKHQPYDLSEGSLTIRENMLRSPPGMWHIINYDALSRLWSRNHHSYAGLLDAFDTVLLDESTRIKSPETNITKLMLAASPYIPYKGCLSGEPAPEGWENIWTQMAFLNDGNWMGHHGFYQWRWMNFFQAGFDWQILPLSEMKIKTQFQKEAYVISRKEAGIRDEKIRQTRTGELSKEAAKIYDHILDKWALPGEEPNEPDNLTNYALVVASWLRRITGGIIPNELSKPIDCWKYDEVLNILDELGGDESVVVWFSFNAELARMYEALLRKGVPVTWINGGVSGLDRGSRISSFQNGEFRVLLAQTACAQFGVNFSRANTAIYFSSPYSYEQRTQSEERIFEVGKANDNLIIDLVTKGTIDEQVIESIHEKASDASVLLRTLKPPSSLAK